MITVKLFELLLFLAAFSVALLRKLFLFDSRFVCRCLSFNWGSLPAICTKIEIVVGGGVGGVAFLGVTCKLLFTCLSCPAIQCLEEKTARRKSVYIFVVFF